MYIHLHLTLLAVGLAACQAPAPAPAPIPLRAPELELSTDYFIGTLLSGKRPELESGTSQEDALLLRLSLYYLKSSPLRAQAPAAAHIDLVADLEGTHPVLSSAALGADAEVLRGAEAERFLVALRADEVGEWLCLKEGLSALSPACTYSLEVSRMERVEDPLDFLDEFEDRGPIRRRVGLRLERTDADGPIRVALTIADLDPEREGIRLAAAREAGPLAPQPPGPAEEELVRHELLRFADGYLPSDKAMVLLIPSPFDDGNGEAFAFALEPATGSDKPAIEAALAAMRRTLSKGAGLPAPTQVMPEETLAAEIASALTAWSAEASRRALLVLVERTGAALTGDLALTVHQADLDALSASFFEGTSAEDLASFPRAVALRLERTSYGLLTQRAEADALKPEQRALLYLHTGALGSYPDTLQDLLRAATDLNDLERRLTQGNFTSLEDSSAALRLRAHDWLAVRGRALPDYKPLDERDLRRAALLAARQATEEQE